MPIANHKGKRLIKHIFLLAKRSRPFEIKGYGKLSPIALAISLQIM